MNDYQSGQLMLPFFSRADFAEPSVFLPENLLREARRQLNLDDGLVPRVCLLDPDGDILDYLQHQDRVARSRSWACYHTTLWETEVDGTAVGIVAGVVGSSFAVLVAEQLFASGCSLLISITSSGEIAEVMPATSMILIDRALRGEGTSHAYLPPAADVRINEARAARLGSSLNYSGSPVIRGASWTTDAPFRETTSALMIAREAGALVVEMEAAALYAFAEARGQDVICFAHVTNSMAVAGADFEKGPTNGAVQALEMLAAIIRNRDEVGQSGT
ncbi:MAG: nucleoside phosphorylase [Thermomicrobiales bacterium]